MALTIPQNIALAQILETQYIDGTNIGGYSILDGMGSTTSTVALAGGTSYQAWPAINTWVTNMSASAVSALQIYLDRWIAIGTSTVRIESGGVGDVTQVTMDPMEECANIRKLVIPLVPFYKYEEVMMKRAGMAANGFNIGVLR